MKAIAMLCCAVMAAPAFGQTIYKCPSPTPGAPPVIQQMPCSPTGGGETLAVKPIAGSGGGLRDSEKDALRAMGEERARIAQGREEAEQAAAAERKRQEALAVERSKAAAQWATANAIWANGRR